MSLQAVGWLSRSLGLNVAGRGGEEGAQQQPDPSNQDGVDDLFGAPRPTATQRFGKLVGNMGQYVFGSSHDYADGSAPPPPVKPKHEDDTVDFDENGLPRTRNWYVYDDVAKCWVVTDDAPDNVKREYELKKQAAEEERLGLKKAVAPPPPPPPGGIMGGQSRAMPSNQYAPQDYFGSSSVPPPVATPVASTPVAEVSSFPLPPRAGLSMPTPVPQQPIHSSEGTPVSTAPPPLPPGGPAPLPFPPRATNAPPGLPQPPTFPLPGKAVSQ